MVDGAREGDEASIRCLRILGERLGIGIANAITMFDPLEVVIGGGVSRGGRAPARPGARGGAEVRRAGRGRAVEIRLARHGPHAGVLGAALLAAQEYAAETGGVMEEAVEGTMKIACAFDHAGFPLKQLVLETVRRARARADRPRDVLDRPGRLPGHGARGR